MKSNAQIAAKFKKELGVSSRKLSKQYQNTKDCQAFEAGDIMDYVQRVQYTSTAGGKKAAMVQFNRVKPYVNAVKGFMAQNRKRGKYVARTDVAPIQEQLSLYSNALKDYILENCNSAQVETQQDGDQLVAGYAAVETNLTYADGYATTDPNGEVQMGRLDPLAVGWDHTAKATNLLDAKYVYYKEVYNLDDAMAMFTDTKKDDFQETDQADADGEYSYFDGGNYDKERVTEGVEWSDEKDKQVKVYFYQWYDVEPFYRCDNPIEALGSLESQMRGKLTLERIAGEIESEEDMFAFDPNADVLSFDKKVKTQLEESFGEYVEIFEYNRKVFYTAVISGDHVFRAGRSVSQQAFTIQFKTGDYDSKNHIWTGMVNSMKDPSIYYNKSLTELMFIIGANSKGGVMVEEGAVEDIQEFEEKYAKTDAVVMVNDGAISQNKIRPKKEPFSPTGYENIISLVDSSFAEVNGIDKSFLGSSENKMQTAALARQQVKQVTSALACYFDSGILFQKTHARILLDLMRIYAENNNGELFRILGEDGAQEFVRISADKLSGEYDISIVEAPQTQEEKLEFAEILSNMADKLMAVGDPSGKVIYAIALKYLPIDKADIQQITKILMPDDKQVDPAYVQQLEDKLKQAMDEQNQADVKKKLSSSALDMANIGKIEIGNQKTQADRVKVLEESNKISVETNLAQQASIKEVSVNL